ncbi:TetR/AcrR family transcriptional regulator [Gordonia amicalis]|uniref:TetR/AcrR family transcriptional regulator n=1 Tax=Gordonia amicalis TaxID=89053 RepID=A0ABU4DJB0_9ACTN|nr:TetR/AcrR family transcriptional regulator [Gordonia amicalis]MDV6309825.1 TetR/AcrR family transcriptional regulator [Gordonia amicalis]MDV7100309.1 TetR/AcrR family transcriptional regulator [Gordonia amicalis]
MAKHGDQARRALLDAAEQLFATEGIDSVSNRKICMHAGNANHSAISYHFGGRENLLRELVERHSQHTRALRSQMMAELPADPAIPDLLRCLIQPVTRYLGGLPVPSWRARFVLQARDVPALAAIVTDVARVDSVVDELVAAIVQAMSVPSGVITGRIWLLSRMVIDACAEYEAAVAADRTPPQWDEFGVFLTDAAAGMLAAPITVPSNFSPASPGALL